MGGTQRYSRAGIREGLVWQPRLEGEVRFQYPIDTNVHCFKAGRVLK